MSVRSIINAYHTNTKQQQQHTGNIKITFRTRNSILEVNGGDLMNIISPLEEFVIGTSSVQQQTDRPAGCVHL